MNLRSYDFGIEEGESLAHIRERWARVARPYLAEVRAVCGGDRLGETFGDVQCQPPRAFTYGGMIAHVLTFAAHRRTLAVGVLAGAGVGDLGDGDPLPWLARPE